MKLVLAVFAGLIFIFLVFLYAKAFTDKYKRRIDNVAKHYGYRNYDHLKKVGEKEEEKVIRMKIREDRRRKYGKQN